MPEQTQHPENVQAASVVSFVVIQVPLGRQGLVAIVIVVHKSF